MIGAADRERSIGHFAPHREFRVAEEGYGLRYPVVVSVGRDQGDELVPCEGVGGSEMEYVVLKELREELLIDQVGPLPARIGRLAPAVAGVHHAEPAAVRRVDPCFGQAVAGVERAGEACQGVPDAYPAVGGDVGEVLEVIVREIAVGVPDGHERFTAVAGVVHEMHAPV